MCHQFVAFCVKRSSMCACQKPGKFKLHIALQTPERENVFFMCIVLNLDQAGVMKLLAPSTIRVANGKQLEVWFLLM